MIWVLRGPGPELKERIKAAESTNQSWTLAHGTNTHEEAEYIADQGGDVLYVVTSAYHVSRAYLTLRASLKSRGLTNPVHVWGTGTVTNIQLQSEAQKLAAAQAKGHALSWEAV